VDRRIFASGLAALTLGACAHTKADTLAPPALPKSTITSVTLDRKGCYGTCPIYTVTFSSGDVATYSGKRYVDNIGKYSGHVDFDLIAAWLDTQALPAKSSVFGSNVIDAENLIVTIVRSDRTVVIESHSYFDLPLSVSGVVAAIDGFADRIKWKASSALDPYMGEFINDRSPTNLLTLTMYAGPTDVEAHGSSMTFTADSCAQGGFTRNEDEVTFQLAGSTGPTVIASKVQFQIPSSSSAATPLAVKFGAGTITLRDGSMSTVYRRVSGRQYDTAFNAFTERAASQARPAACPGTGPH
jgi:Domain of unknown function (DUF6438)